MISLKPKESLNRTRLHGFTLVEVLVALLVLSIGLLGLAALQTTSLKYNTDSYFRTQATLLAYDIIDRMRSNTTGIYAGNYDAATGAIAATKIAAYNTCKASSCQCDANVANCSTSSLATYDLGKWYEKISATLPEGYTNLATVSRSVSNLVTITIQWRERDIFQSHVWEVQL